MKVCQLTWGYHQHRCLVNWQFFFPSSIDKQTKNQFIYICQLTWRYHRHRCLINWQLIFSLVNWQTKRNRFIYQLTRGWHEYNLSIDNSFTHSYIGQLTTENYNCIWNPVWTPGTTNHEVDNWIPYTIVIFCCHFTYIAVSKRIVNW